MYTFIMEFRGGTYITQVYAVTLEEAILNWGEKIQIQKIKHLGLKSNKEIRFILLNPDDDDKPVELDGGKNIWFLCLLLKVGCLHINIVKTDPN